MSELGEESERGHREVGEAAAAFGVDELIAVGATGAAIARAARESRLEEKRRRGWRGGSGRASWGNCFARAI